MYFPVRGCVRTLRTLYVYATAGTNRFLVPSVAVLFPAAGSKTSNALTEDVTSS